MIKFTLYENSIDSITHGIEHLEKGHKTDSKTDYKQSILLTFQGTELLLKSLISQINVIYMFDKNSLYEKCTDPLNPTLEELESCRSLEIPKLCKEIYKFYPEDFPKKSLKIVEKMAILRNQIQHFGITIEKTKYLTLFGELYLDVISKGLKLLGALMSPEKNKSLEEELKKIFDFFGNARNEAKVLKILGKDFTRGNCIKCNNHSLFILYDEYGGYPESTYCSSCDFELTNINVQDFRECPECGANSLLYIEKEAHGICLWHRCANHKDGGISIDMSPCDQCDDYVIEGNCICGYKE